MNLTKHRALAARLLGSAVMVGMATCSIAQEDYPNRPIRYIVPYSPGGSTTWTSRLVGEHLTSVWGKQVIIDNRAGGGTVIGTEVGVRSKPDGYTLIYIGSALCSNVTLMKTPYDAEKDIAPIAIVSQYENLLAVHPSVPARTLKEFIALAKARPGELNYATSSHGGSTHLAPVLFSMVAGIKITQIPYKGGGPAVADLMGGQVQFIMAVPVNIVGHIQNGRLRGIAVTGSKRISSLPDVPSFTEAGLPDVSLSTWQGLGAPAGTPKAIVDKISAEVAKLVAMPETKKKLDAQGFEPYYQNPEQTAALIKRDIARFAKIIKAGNIKLH
ncbi:MAG: tripartite tricarboxylate transporter substrate binding protein [Betaproteobacteria bacterium]|nr:MAG: tripartite tricarboxylate transporter substrate binding protein [Betaproteobacteria bacterium]